MKDLSLHILDIVQNSIRAGASTIRVFLSMSPDDRLVLQISDNGMGMNDEQLRQVQDPFFTTRTTRRIGLGIPLLVQKAEQSGGSVRINSEPGRGTSVVAEFNQNHPDLPPMGDVAACAWMLMAANPSIRFCFQLTHQENAYEWDSLEIQKNLGGLPLTQVDVRALVIDWFNQDFCNFKGTSN